MKMQKTTMDTQTLPCFDTREGTTVIIKIQATLKFPIAHNYCDNPRETSFTQVLCKQITETEIQLDRPSIALKICKLQ